MVQSFSSTISLCILRHAHVVQYKRSVFSTWQTCFNMGTILPAISLRVRNKGKPQSRTRQVMPSYGPAVLQGATSPQMHSYLPAAPIHGATHTEAIQWPLYWTHLVVHSLYASLPLLCNACIVVSEQVSAQCCQHRRGNPSHSLPAHIMVIDKSTASLPSRLVPCQTLFAC